MNVEIWSDFACPFCYIGKQRFEQALEQFSHKEDVKIVFKSFELDPNAPVREEHDVHDMLVGKYGMKREEAIAMNHNIGVQAAQSGLDFQFDAIQLTNTFDAHRLAKYADQQGKAAIFQDLFKAYFTDGRHLGDHETLIQLALEAGLDESSVRRLLASSEFADKVRQDEEEAQQLGVTSVPFFVIDRKYAISGAQASDTFLQALNTSWGEPQPLQILGDVRGSDSDGTCSDDGCSIQ